MTASPQSDAPGAPAAQLVGVSKRFGDLWAVRRADLALWPGEIHAVLGENGAGKTTLMCMLAGLYRPDGGRVEVGGRALRFRSPRDAMAAGVGMVHQHFMLVPTLTAAENVLLGAERIPPWIAPRRLVRDVQQTADRLGLRVDAGALVGTLSVGEQQRVEILRVLARGARVLILDEPTAVLSPEEAQALYDSLERLTGEGCAVVLISHKLEELRRAARRITVLRRGEVVAQIEDAAGASADELAVAMVGHEVSLHVKREAQPPGPPLLRVEGLRARSDRGVLAVDGVSLKLRAGEIVGLAGVAGNGQPELLETIAGTRFATEGRITLDEQPIDALSARQRVDRGLRFVPEDRHHTGTAPSLSVAENLLLRAYRQPPCRRGPLLDLGARAAECAEQVEALKIATAGLEQSARLLSGGNLQKVILARELSPEARVILALHPTRGLDAWATAEVRRLLLAARGRGAGVLLCSEDLDEILALADRVLVVYGGRIVCAAAVEDLDAQTIGRAMAGRGGPTGPMRPVREPQLEGGAADG